VEKCFDEFLLEGVELDQTGFLGVTGVFTFDGVQHEFDLGFKEFEFGFVTCDGEFNVFFCEQMACDIGQVFYQFL